MCALDRSEYVEVANFFHCMDSCDTQYMVKRTTVILPLVALGKKLYIRAIYHAIPSGL